jgi:LAO/AO transport system kinase
MTLTAGADLVSRVRAGEALACARLMSLAEAGDARFTAEYARFWPELGRARRYGITGPPGAGKSTLVEGLALHWRGLSRTVGVVAVDPTSPFSGGALLGDRVRMGRLALDAGVFIRSMATRGVFGGLARASDDVVDVLDLYGRDTVLIETVGVGQSEVDIARSADLTVVVLHPGGGDTIQAMKAGLMEVADIYLVNKADMPGLDRLVQQLTDILDLREIPPDRRPPILTSVASTGEGVAALAAELDRMHAARAASGALAARRSENLEKRVRRLVEGRLRHDVWETLGLAEALARRVAAGGPHSAWGLADEILDCYRKRRTPESHA